MVLRLPLGVKMSSVFPLLMFGARPILSNSEKRMEATHCVAGTIVPSSRSVPKHAMSSAHVTQAPGTRMSPGPVRRPIWPFQGGLIEGLGGLNLRLYVLQEAVESDGP